MKKDSQIKILFLASDLGAIGGIQNYNQKLIKELQGLGVRVFLMEMKNASILGKLFFSAKFFFFCILFWPDFIVFSNINFSPLAWVARIFLRRPYGITVYGIEVISLSSFFKQNLSKAKYIIALFQATADRVIAQIPESQSRIIFIPNSVDGEKFFIRLKSRVIMDKYGLRDKKIIMTFGRMSVLDGENKGYERVLRAMPDVLKKIPNAVYVLAGKGDDVPRMEALAKELGISHNVIFTGSVKNEELLNYYSVMDVFAFPSKNEGFPAIVLLEALACGKPVVAGAQAKSEVTILNGEVGLLVPPDDVEAISNALITILSGAGNANFYDPDFLRRRVLEVYGQNPYKKTVKHFLEKLSV